MIGMEIGFIILYLVTIYGIVIGMYMKFRSPAFENLPGSKVFLIAFLLLAIGDTGHVGFRLVAFARGGIEENELLVGLGALASAVMVTLFYMLLAEVWKRQTSRPRNLLFWLVIILGVLRLAFMTLEGNQWDQAVPPFEFSVYRNTFLTIMGLIIVVVYLRDGAQKRLAVGGHPASRFLMLSGIAIICSFAFYIPVILFVQKIPMIGMMMIPKTIAYVWLALIGYRRLFSKVPSVVA